MYNQNTAQSIGLSNLAGQLQNNVATSLSAPPTTPTDINSIAQNSANANYAQQTQYLDPQFAQAQEQLDAKNANQGITPGSQADNTDQLNLANEKQQAYSNAQESAINQGTTNAQNLFSLSSAAQMQPLNEFNALRSQSQATLPTFGQATPVSAQPTNTAQITQQAYQNSLNPYNAQIAANNQTTGGLFGLGGSLASAAILASDIRLKENIKYVGLEKGIPIYTWIYLADKDRKTYRGTIAQAIIETHPNAVISDGEYYKVDYSKLGIKCEVVH